MNGYDGWTPPAEPDPVETHECTYCQDPFLEENMTLTPFGWICNTCLFDIDLNFSECCHAPFKPGTTECSECCGQYGPYVLTQAERETKLQTLISK